MSSIHIPQARASPGLPDHTHVQRWMAPVCAAREQAPVPRTKSTPMKRGPHPCGSCRG
jgi:hypothetical protein